MVRDGEVENVREDGRASAKGQGRLYLYPRLARPEDS